MQSSRIQAAVKRFSREPLLLFLAVGSLLFGADWFMRSDTESAEPLQIELTADDVRQLSVSWLAQGRPAPSPAELQGLVDQKVALEIMVREAEAMGLDKGDEVIKRRLAQKMDFLLEGIAQAEEPTEADLRAWFKLNAEQFANPPRLDFHHVYFALDHGASQEKAEKAERMLANEPANTSMVEGVDADPFMFQATYRDVTPDQVAKEFGPGFARALLALPPGKWEGPVISGYGAHVVFVDASVPGSTPAFEEIAPKIKTAWLDEQGRELKRKAYEQMRARYTVVTPPLDDPALVQPLPVEQSQ